MLICDTTPPLKGAQVFMKCRSGYSVGIFMSDPAHSEYLKIEIVHWAVFLRLALIFVTHMYKYSTLKSVLSCCQDIHIYSELFTDLIKKGTIFPVDLGHPYYINLGYKNFNDMLYYSNLQTGVYTLHNKNILYLALTRFYIALRILYSRFQQR